MKSLVAPRPAPFLPGTCSDGRWHRLNPGTFGHPLGMAPRWERLSSTVQKLRAAIRLEIVFFKRRRLAGVFRWDVDHPGWVIAGGSAVTFEQALEDANEAFDAAEASDRLGGPHNLTQAD